MDQRGIFIVSNDSAYGLTTDNFIIVMLCQDCRIRLGPKSKINVKCKKINQGNIDVIHEVLLQYLNLLVLRGKPVKPIATDDTV